MSLAGLKADLREYQREATKWGNSIGTWQQRITATNAQLDYLNQQMALASAALGACQAITGPNDGLEAEIDKVASALSTALEDDGGTAGVKRLYQNNGSELQGAIQECDALIQRLSEKIQQANTLLAQQQDGLATCQDQASYYSGLAQQTQRAIDNYQ